MLAASLVIIGDELLGGHVVDANTPWLAAYLGAHGVPLERVHVVPDTHAAIDEALTAELARGGPRLVFTSGGIGSTPDDVTYDAVAASLGRGVVEHPVLAERIRGAVAWAQRQGIEVTDEYVWHLGRMARVPDGAEVLAAEGRFAAAVTVTVDGGADASGSTVVVLPGVPSEFRALVEDLVGPRLVVERNPVPVTVELEHGLPESALNPAFVRLGTEHPAVKLGSYPGRPMLVRLSGLDADEVEAAATLVQDAIDHLSGGEVGRRLRAAWAGRDGDEEDHE